METTVTMTVREKALENPGNGERKEGLGRLEGRKVRRSMLAVDASAVGAATRTIRYFSCLQSTAMFQASSSFSSVALSPLGYPRFLSMISLNVNESFWHLALAPYPSNSFFLCVSHT
jgi:hypothetical protein